MQDNIILLLFLTISPFTMKVPIFLTFSDKENKKEDFIQKNTKTYYENILINQRLRMNFQREINQLMRIDTSDVDSDPFLMK
ncbi:hypothetical protein BpHYR1_036617 [Brachionus plicatilis]|uniref:Uncharacterized protein n=1 Tax=Brachionus plicatilis TaxID=10195 RepID=A0A3M7SGQ5_BRAPC|nr:hypothetical protein BpHYR1_036617 [Brachionus plicatilis]